MPDELIQLFEARRPLLERAAQSIVDELSVICKDASLNHTIDFHVVSSEEFRRLLKEVDHELGQSRVVIPVQIKIRVHFAETANIGVAASIIQHNFSIIRRWWHDAPDATGPMLNLQCAIPPQAKPNGWAQRTDVPNVFELELRQRGAALQSYSPHIVLYPVDPNEPFALIMKGGGIKGLAYVGAVEELTKKYKFNWFVGTSAGAITAVLLGAGYSVEELREILKSKNFKDFLDAPWYKAIINLFFYQGLFKANAFTDWLDELLARKLEKATRVKLSDLPHRVTVYASQRDKKAMCFDSFDNDTDAAFAVRCSMSIPGLFVPQSNQGFSTYDGGLKHNYPVDVLLSAHPGTPFISLYLGAEIYEPKKQRFLAICVPYGLNRVMQKLSKNTVTKLW